MREHEAKECEKSSRTGLSKGADQGMTRGKAAMSNE